MAHTDVKAFEELELLTKVTAILGDLLFFLFNRTFPNILITSFNSEVFILTPAETTHTSTI